MRGEGLSVETIRQIESADQPVVLLRGPARSGKTSAVLDWITDNRRVGRRCFLLVPNRSAVDWYVGRLMRTSESDRLVYPDIMTFAAFGAKVLAWAGLAERMISPLGRYLLLKGVIDDLHADGKLEAISAVVDTPGAVTAVDRAIAELKRSAVEPDGLAGSVAGGPAKGRDLLKIYRLYQHRLVERGLYDVEGQMWLVRKYLSDAPKSIIGRLEGIWGIVADGFTDFTPTQLEILKLASLHVKRTLITLPWAEEPHRARMWHWTQRTMSAIRGTFTSRLREIELCPDQSSPGASPAALGDLGENLFDLDRRKGASDPPDCLKIVSAASAEEEVSAAAGWTKRLLQKNPSDSIAVVARSLEAYREPIERIFKAHCIPIDGLAGALNEVPIVRFALDVLSIGPEFVHTDVLRVIKNSYFRPGALGRYDDRTVATAEDLIRTGNVVGGRSAYSQAVRRLAGAARSAERTDDEDEPFQAQRRSWSADEYLQAGRMLEALFELSSAPGGLEAIVDRLELRESACRLGWPELIARDLRALSTLRDAISEPGAAELSAGSLKRALSVVPCTPGRGLAMVEVLDVLDARPMRFDHLVFLGLVEGGFPRRYQDSSLIGESDRKRWSAEGVDLDSRRDLSAREMLLFYLGMTRPDKTLWLGYSCQDDDPQASPASPYLQGIVEQLGGMELARRTSLIERIGPGEFTPSAGRIATAGQAVLAGLAGRFQPALDDEKLGINWAVRHAAEIVSAFSRGLWLNYRRWQPGNCDEYDGRLDESAVEALSADRAGREIFSASRLSSYSLCPWGYFATYVLDLRPPLSVDRQMEPQAAGLYCHAVLERVFTRLRDRLGEAFVPANVGDGELLAELDRAMADQDESIATRPPAYPALWRAQRSRIRDELIAYLLELKSDRPVGVPIHLELAFGCGTDRLNSCDPASRPEPVTLDTPDGPVRLRGQIDRVDRLLDADPCGVMVIDYKTGRLATKNDVQAGRSLQLPIYAWAAGQLLNMPVYAAAFHRIGSGKSKSRHLMGGLPGEKEKIDSFLDDLESSRNTIGRIAREIGMGRFDLSPAANCPSYCPHRMICQYSRFRLELKTPSPRVQP